MRRRNLTPADIAGIADRWARGQSQYSIAKFLGIQQAVVWYWVTRQRISPETVAQNIRLKRENNSLKRKLKFLSLKNKAATHLIVNWVPGRRRRSLIVPLLRAKFSLTRAQANSVVGLNTRAGDVSKAADRVLIDMMWRYIAQHPYAGFKTLFGVLKHAMPATRYHALQLYKQAITSKPSRSHIKPKRRPPIRYMAAQKSVDEMWSIDFMRGVLNDKTSFWIVTGIDDFNREALFAKVAKRRSGLLAVDAIDRIGRAGRSPAAIRSDNGREFRGRLYSAYLESKGIRRMHTLPYQPNHNCYAEMLNRLIRYEVLDRYSFTSLAQVQKRINEWMRYYNFARPQMPLGDMSPLQYSHYAAEVTK